MGLRPLYSMHKLIAKVLAYPAVRDRIIRYAMKHPYYHIPDDGSYMERYWIIREGSWLSLLFRRSVRLHIIKLPDQDRALHTHPFSFRSYIIQGDYWEARNAPPDAVNSVDHFPRACGTTYTLDRDTAHAISWIENGPVYTVFTYDERQGDWYFDTDRGLIPHAQYLNKEAF